MSRLAVSRPSAPGIIRPIVATAAAGRASRLARGIIARHTGRGIWPAWADIWVSRQGQPDGPSAETSRPPMPLLIRLRAEIRLIRTLMRGPGADPAERAMRRGLTAKPRAATRSGLEQSMAVIRRPSAAAGATPLAYVDRHPRVWRPVEADAGIASPDRIRMADMRIIDPRATPTVSRRLAVPPAGTPAEIVVEGLIPPGNAGPASETGQNLMRSPVLPVTRGPAMTMDRPPATPGLAPETLIVRQAPARTPRGAATSRGDGGPEPWTRPMPLTIERRRPMARAQPEARLARSRRPLSFTQRPPLVIPRLTPGEVTEREIAMTVAGLPPMPGQTQAARLDVRRPAATGMEPAGTGAGPSAAPPPPGLAPYQGQGPGRDTAPVATAVQRVELDGPGLNRALRQLPSSDIAPFAERLFEHFERHLRRGLERRGRL
jgi:hypothetical protein